MPVKSVVPQSPNENKISYSGARRGSCVRSKAGDVTRGAVSCIAWLGDLGLFVVGLLMAAALTRLCIGWRIVPVIRRNSIPIVLIAI